jgi:hypothetical protein
MKTTGQSLLVRFVSAFEITEYEVVEHGNHSEPSQDSAVLPNCAIRALPGVAPVL